MPVKLEFAKQEDAPEALREHLTEYEGRWLFEGESGAEVQNLKKTLGKYRKADEELQKIKPDYAKLQKFKDFSDEDFEAYNEWKKANESGEGDDKNGKLDSESLKQLKQQYKQELAKAKADAEALVKAEQEKYTGLTTQLKRERLTTALTSAAAKAGVFEDQIGSFVDFMLYKGHFGWEDGENGKPGRAVWIEDGEPSTDITLDKAFKDLLPVQYGTFFEAVMKNGTGQQRAGGGGKRPTKRSEMTPKEKSEYIKAHGNKKYLELPA